VLLQACLLEQIIIFNAEIETNVIQQTLPSQENGNVTLMTLSPFGTVKEIVNCSIKQQANTFHPTIKFTSEISENGITFLDTVVFKGERNRKIHPSYRNLLQADGNLLIYPFWLVPPSGGKKRFYKRRSIKTA